MFLVHVCEPVFSRGLFELFEVLALFEYARHISPLACASCFALLRLTLLYVYVCPHNRYSASLQLNQDVMSEAIRDALHDDDDDDDDDDDGDDDDGDHGDGDGDGDADGQDGGRLTPSSSSSSSSGMTSGMSDGGMPWATESKGEPRESRAQVHVVVQKAKSELESKLSEGQHVRTLAIQFGSPVVLGGLIGLQVEDSNRVQARTLCHLLSGDVLPTAGAIYIPPLIKSVQVPWRGEANVLDGSLMENLRFGTPTDIPDPYTDETIFAVCRCLCLSEELITEEKRGSKILLHDRTRKMFGVDSHIVAVVRAVLCNPDVLIVPVLTRGVNKAEAKKREQRLGMFLKAFSYIVPVTSTAEMLNSMLLEATKIAMTDAGEGMPGGEWGGKEFGFPSRFPPRTVIWIAGADDVLADVGCSRTMQFDGILLAPAAGLPWPARPYGPTGGGMKAVVASLQTYGKLPRRRSYDSSGVVERGVAILGGGGGTGVEGVEGAERRNTMGKYRAANASAPDVLNCTFGRRPEQQHEQEQQQDPQTLEQHDETKKAGPMLQQDFLVSAAEKPPPMMKAGKLPPLEVAHAGSGDEGGDETLF